MKRILAILLAVLTLFTLSACGKESVENTPSPAPEQTVAPEPEQTAESSPGGGTSDPFDPSAAMEETVLVDESDVKVTATGLKYTANSLKINLAIENNSGKNLSFRCGTIGYSCNSVNGYMTDEGYLNASVAAGKKINETVSFSSDELSLMGFTDIADIELGFNIIDDQYDDYLQTGPRQLKTSIADSYNYSTDTYRESITDSSKAKEFGFTVNHDSEELVYDQKGVRVLSQTLVTNSSGEQALFVEVENTSTEMVYVAVGDVSVNGLGIQSGIWFTNWISAGKRRVIPLELYSMLGKAHQEAFGIDEIGSVTYSLTVEDIDFDALVNPQQIAFSTPDGGSYDSSGEELYQGDGIRVVSKGLAPDSFDLSDDIHVLLLVENNGSEALNFDVGYDTVSVNGYMTGFICYGKRVEAGGSAVLDVELTGYSLEDNGITGLEDITEAELTLEVKTDNYKTVAEPVVTIAVSQ